MGWRLALALVCQTVLAPPPGRDGSTWGVAAAPMPSTPRRKGPLPPSPGRRRGPWSPARRDGADPEPPSPSRRPTRENRRSNSDKAGRALDASDKAGRKLNPRNASDAFMSTTRRLYTTPSRRLYTTTCNAACDIANWCGAGPGEVMGGRVGRGGTGVQGGGARGGGSAGGQRGGREGGLPPPPHAKPNPAPPEPPAGTVATATADAIMRKTDREPIAAARP